MAEIGSASLGIIPSFDGFQGKLESGSNKAMLSAGASGGTKFGDAAGKSAGSRFGSVFKKAATAGLVGIGALGVGAFKLAKDSIGAASDLAESTNKVKQVFGEGADRVFQFSEKAADSLGQTNQQARDAAATFGLFGKIAGLNDKKTAGFATRMDKLASDLASFHNTEPDQAVEALGAALRGEAEPIRSYGVLLDEAALKAEALRLNLLKPVKDQAKINSYQISVIEKQRDYNEAVKEHGKASFEAEKADAALGNARELLGKATEGTIPPLTQQQKVLAASSAIFRQTKVAQGDFARTSDGLANQQRRLSARFEDAKAKLGAGLLPIMTDAADFLLDEGIPAFEKFSDWFNDEGIPGLKRFGGFLKDDVAPYLKTAANGAKALAGFLDKLPTDIKIRGLAGLAVLLGASKLRGGGGGLLGSAGSALGLAKPVPVFVTNPGGLGGGGGVGGGPAGKGGKPTGGTPGTARMVGRLILPIAIGDAIYETLFDDLYGTLEPPSGDPNKDREKLSPIIKTGGGAFGIGLNQDPAALKGKKFGPNDNDMVRLFDGVRNSAEDAGDSVDGLGIRIGAMVNSSKARADSLEDKLTLVGSKKIRPEVDLGSIDRARQHVDGLAGALDHLATAASSGIDAAGQVVVGAVTGRNDGRGRAHNRRRNLGGFP